MVDFSAQYRLIGARIAYFRKLKRYTQEELAFRASISTSYLSRIERGIYSKGVPISTLMQISKIFFSYLSFLSFFYIINL